MPARLEENYTRYPRPLLWLLRAGEVTIGGDAADCRPRFVAHVASFYLSKFPVSNRQYEAYAPRHRRGDASPGDDDPAVGLSFEEARDYCAWYAGVSRKPMRLPTEIEWEYACRAGSNARFFFGDDPGRAEPFVWDAANSAGRLVALERKRPNGFGLYGMLGGVWEWTSSRFLPYPAVDGDGRDEAQAAGPRVLRGGSYRTPRGEIGCADRRPGDPALGRDDIGFRVARSL